MFQGTGALAFNAAFYLQQNPDVFQAIQNGTFQGSALDHFVQFGQFEGRDPNAFFDTSYYLENNTDVLVAIADPANPSVVSAFQHFVDFGSEEGVVRAPSAAFASFNAETYLAQNPDLQAAFGNLTGEALEDRLFQHFVEFGVNENRPGSGVDPVANPGSNFVLTTGIDNLVGTSGDDVFTGVDNGPVTLAGSTLQTGDTIDGGGGFDTLRVIANQGIFGGGAQAVTPNLTNIERVEYSLQNTNAGLNLAQSTGVQEVAVVGGAGVTGGLLNVVGVQAPVTVELSNTSGSIDLDYATNVKSPTTGQNVVLNGADGGTVDVNNASTFNVTATGENTVQNLIGGTTTATKLTTLNVDGSGSLLVASALAATITTVNASANTGGIEVDLSATTKDVTVTGGAGDDVFVFGAALSKTDTVNGGEGFDTVVVDSGNYTAAADAAPFNALKSIERVEFVSDSEDGVGTTLQGSTFTNTGITNLLFNTGGTDTIFNAGTARTYEFGTGNAGDAVFEMKAGATELNLVLLGDEDGSASVGDIDVTLAGSAAATAVSTINLSSVGTFEGEDEANSVGVIDARAGSTVNIDGSANLTIEGFGSAVVVDASDFSGELVIRGSQFSGIEITPATPGTPAVPPVLDEDGEIVTPGIPEVPGTPASGGASVSGADTITLGSGQSTIQFTAEDSGFVVTTTDATTAQGLIVDVINGFTAGAGGDVLDFIGNEGDSDYTALSATAQASINALSGDDATLLNAANTAAANFTTADEWTAFSFQGETYAFYNAGTDTTFNQETDVLVRLNGVTDIAALSDANFA